MVFLSTPKEINEWTNKNLGVHYTNDKRFIKFVRQKDLGKAMFIKTHFIL